MVSVAKPWLICGYHDLIIVAWFLVFMCSKTMVNFRKVMDSSYFSIIEI